MAQLFPPAKPDSVPGALQQSMPLADVMDIISKPPGSTPPFIPYKPVPPLVPLPAQHTLPVSRPHVVNDRSAFGDLTEDPLQVLSSRNLQMLVDLVAWWWRMYLSTCAVCGGGQDACEDNCHDQEGGY